MSDIRQIESDIFFADDIRTNRCVGSKRYPGAALGYSGIATILYEPMDMGEGAEPQENSFEVITGDGYGGGILDCNPVQCLGRVLTDATWGLGVGAVPFPPSVLDTGAGGTWGAPGTPGVQQTGSTAWNWFAANNFFISPVLDSQDSAASTMSKWLESGMCAAFFSEGLLKLVPYGDTSVAANGCTWTAPTSFVVALDDTCFIAKDGVDPVTIKRSAWQDAYNTVSVQWNNRANQYAQEVTQESDQSLINRFGSRIEDPQDWNHITTLSAATFAANMRIKRSSYIRNEYTFALPYNYGYLEPMDVVTISTTSVWAMGLNNENLGVTNLPVRITKIVDDPVEGLAITAEDYPFGSGQATIYNKQISQAEPAVNMMADPGTSEVVMFEATGRLTSYTGNEIWIGACGTGQNYGATNVWVSQDNLTYVKVTQLGTPSILGKTVADFATGTDPDTTNTLEVQLAENCPPLSAGSTTAADNDTMLCWVDGEVISYSAAALTAQNTYTLGTYIRRGQMGTPISDHAPGSDFLRLDNSIYRYAYDPTWEGKTVYFKFQAINNFGNNPQPLSNLTATTFTIGTGNTATVDASSGLVFSSSLPPNVSTNSAANASMTSTYDSTTSTSTISVFGPSGAGTSWSYQVGSKVTTYPASSLVGLTPTIGTVYVFYDVATSSYGWEPVASYQLILNDNYIVLGSVIVATATTTTTGSGTSGTGTGAGSNDGGGYACTVEGTSLDTLGGPVDNREIKQRFDAGEDVYLSGRYGAEKVIALNWCPVSAVYRVEVDGCDAFECSASHLLRVRGFYEATASLADVEGLTVETRTGYRPAKISRVVSDTRVLQVSLDGPSHEYSSDGVFTHNMKPSNPILTPDEPQ